MSNPGETLTFIIAYLNLQEKSIAAMTSRANEAIQALPENIRPHQTMEYFTQTRKALRAQRDFLTKWIAQHTTELSVCKKFRLLATLNNDIAVYDIVSNIDLKLSALLDSLGPSYQFEDVESLIEDVLRAHLYLYEHHPEEFTSMNLQRRLDTAWQLVPSVTRTDIL